MMAVHTTSCELKTIRRSVGGFLVVNTRADDTIRELDETDLRWSGRVAAPSSRNFFRCGQQRRQNKA